MLCPQLCMGISPRRCTEIGLLKRTLAAGAALCGDLNVEAGSEEYRAMIVG
jgi:endonuclease/exonuclease/phosphatase family metal-dependent hydrolase